MSLPEAVPPEAGGGDDSGQPRGWRSAPHRDRRALRLAARPRRRRSRRLDLDARGPAAAAHAGGGGAARRHWRHVRKRTAAGPGASGRLVAGSRPPQRFDASRLALGGPARPHDCHPGHGLAHLHLHRPLAIARPPAGRRLARRHHRAAERRGRETGQPGLGGSAGVPPAATAIDGRFGGGEPFWRKPPAARDSAAPVPSTAICRAPSRWRPAARSGRSTGSSSTKIRACRTSTACCCASTPKLGRCSTGPVTRRIAGRGREDSCALWRRYASMERRGLGGRPSSPARPRGHPARRAGRRVC